MGKTAQQSRAEWGVSGLYHQTANRPGSYVFSGVWPSPATATFNRRNGARFFRAPSSLVAPAPGDGRTPLNRSWLLVALCLLLGSLTSVGAMVRFDVFLGYDGILPEASWFPVSFEV